MFASLVANLPATSLRRPLSKYRDCEILMDIGYKTNRLWTLCDNNFHGHKQRDTYNMIGQTPEELAQSCSWFSIIVEKLAPLLINSTELGI